jgi:hypothetical protein
LRIGNLKFGETNTAAGRDTTLPFQKCQLKREIVYVSGLYPSLDPPRIPLKKGDFERFLFPPTTRLRCTHNLPKAGCVRHNPHLGKVFRFNLLIMVNGKSRIKKINFRFFPSFDFPLDLCVHRRLPKGGEGGSRPNSQTEDP